MPDPQGLISFPGLHTLTGGSFTLSHGIRPSIANLPCRAVATNLPETGPLTLTYGRVRIVFPDCRVLSTQQQSRGLTWSVQIQDRRWRWQFGEVSGVYNWRKSDGEIEEESKKSLQELAKLLLEAMGEIHFDVSALSRFQWPEVDWQNANPAVELDRLCESQGCRVVLGLDNRVRIARINRGAFLGLTPGVFVEGRSGYNRKPLPRYVRVAMAPVKFQSKFELQAVGLDTDGNIREIDRLSYTPPGGWAKQDPRLFSGIPIGFAGPVANLQEAVLKKNARVLALATVFRWYRIFKLADGTLHPQGLDKNIGPFDEFWQYLPLSANLVETVKDPQGKDVPRKGWVEGEYWPGTEDFKNTPEFTQYQKSWTLEPDQGVVQFDDPVVMVDEQQRTWAGAAKLYLTCSYQLQTRDTKNYGKFVRGYRRREVNRDAREHEGLVLFAEDLLPTIRHLYNNKNKVARVIHNFDEMDQQADQLIEAKLDEYTPDAPQDFSYAGFRPIEPDGAIQQVTWSTGGSGALTRVSRLQEHNLHTGFHEERRREARQQEAERRELGRLLQGIDRRGRRLRT